jgi:Spy/CpxP family protein refolding chaperone
MSEELNTKLEELLDAELTENEVTAMEKEIEDLTEVEEVGGVAKMKSPSGKAKPLKSGGGDSSELKDESEDLGDAADGKTTAKKAKPTNSAGSETKVKSGSSATATPGEKMKLAAGDESDHDGEQLEEARMTKAKMLEDLAKQMEGLSKLNKSQLGAVHEKIAAALKGDEEVSESKDDAELKELEAKKKEIEERMKNISVKEDVTALVDGEDLSEEFKDKAAIIFETAVKSKVKVEIEKLEEEYAEKLQSDVAEALTETSDKVDSYLAYVVEEWMKQNEVAIEHKLKTEITENFITGLKGLLEQQEILIDVASGLADTEVEKFVGLAESVGYESGEDYRNKLNTIKESYFQRTVKEDEDVAAPVYHEQGDISSNMAAYMTAIGKQEKRAQK